MQKEFFIMLIGSFVFFNMLAVVNENLNLSDSSFEELRFGYVGVYNPDKKTVTCTKLSQSNEIEKKIFSKVSLVNCCDECKGKIIGTCKNLKYDPTKRLSDSAESPFFFITTEQ